MIPDILKTPVEYLKGVGPQRADLLKKELSIFTFYDLLHFFPFRYIDRSKYYLVRQINEEMPYVQLKGTISNLQSHGNRRTTRMTAIFTDEQGDSLELVWFKGFQWLKNKFLPREKYIIFGKPTRYGNKINIAHPETEPANGDAISQQTSLQAVYSSTEKLKSKGLDSKGISKIMKNLILQAKESVRETLPPQLREELKIMDKKPSMINIHFPENHDKLAKASARLKFEELFYLQLNLLKMKKTRNTSVKGQIFREVGKFFHLFYEQKLSFELTNAQKRVIKEIRKDTLSGMQMNRLLQGDVGSGKTIVALLSLLICAGNSFQGCIMAPTEVLANQHFESISKLLEGMNMNVKLLTGSTRKKERTTIHQELESGSIHILIGTHALIEDTVVFRNLGLVVIDEQHRFGVAQRARLWKKNAIPPHVLVMTATPIPRTLAMTLYGDLDNSVIDELPPGRKPIKTIHRYDSHRLRVFQFMRDEIRKGRQVYVVYPLIEESEKLDLKDLMDGFDSIERAFPLPEYAVSMVHGKMKAKDKDYEMQRFVKGETQIMVATTVIEVGINVPNASIMIIENAERFGLSQLHQLRGRVGRGADQSYCILMTGFKLSNDGRERIQTMVSTNDGFKIAEADMKLRGPGDMQGTQQSGLLDLKIADITKDDKILKVARNKAWDILEKDPVLQLPENAILKQTIHTLYKDKITWSRIS